MPVEPPEDRPSARAAWARRATRGSAVTALAALSAFGTLGSAHAQSPTAPQQHHTARHATQHGDITVAPGDSVWSLATKHGVTVAALLDANDIPAHAMLRPGDRIVLPREADPHTHPAPADRPPSEKPAGRHVVAAGDTVWDLALEHGVSVLDLQRANDLTASSLLRPGQTLRIPGRHAQPERADAAAAQQASSTSPPVTRAADETNKGSDAAVGDTFAGRTYPEHVVESANKHQAELQRRAHPSREALQTMIRQTAETMGVDPKLALAHAVQESGFQQNVVSPADAVGTMQVIPSAGEWASALVGRDLDLLDAQDNVTAGVAIIRELQDRAPSKELGIGAYYQGLHGVKTYGLFSDTKDYVRAVTAQEKRFA